MRSKKKDFGMQIGSSSLLLVFVVLCLVSFAALAIVSANADSKLTRRLVDHTAAYYEACSSAQDSLAGIDAILQQAYEEAGSQDAYFDAVEETYSFTVPIAENQELAVSLAPQYPQKDGDPYYRITTWQVRNIASLELDDTLPLFTAE